MLFLDPEVFNLYYILSFKCKIFLLIFFLIIKLELYYPEIIIVITFRCISFRFLFSSMHSLISFFNPSFHCRLPSSNIFLITRVENNPLPLSHRLSVASYSLHCERPSRLSPHCQLNRHVPYRLFAKWMASGVAGDVTTMLRTPGYLPSGCLHGFRSVLHAGSIRTHDLHSSSGTGGREGGATRKFSYAPPYCQALMEHALDFHRKKILLPHYFLYPLHSSHSLFHHH